MNIIAKTLYGTTLLATTLLAACDKGGGASAECAPIESAISDARALADEALVTFRAGLQQAVAAPPTAGTAACSVDVNRGLANHRAVRPDGIDAFSPPKVRETLGRADTAGMTVQDCDLYGPPERQTAIDEVQAAMEQLRSGHDLVVLEQSRVEPVVVQGTSTFTPGQLQARLLVWSYAEARFVCVADASAVNRDEVTVTNQRLHSDHLNEDLDRQVARSGARNLRAVAP